MFSFDKESIFTTEKSPIFAIIPVSGAGRHASVHKYIAAAINILQLIFLWKSKRMFQLPGQTGLKEQTGVSHCRNMSECWNTVAVDSYAIESFVQCYIRILFYDIVVSTKNFSENQIAPRLLAGTKPIKDVFTSRAPLV